MTDKIKFRLLSIDAWRQPEGWNWNNWFKLQEGIELTEAQLKPRAVFRWLRDKGYLSDASKGKVMLDDLPTDRYHLTICDRNTGEPLFCLEEMEPDL